MTLTNEEVRAAFCAVWFWVGEDDELSIRLRPGTAGRTRERTWRLHISRSGAGVITFRAPTPCECYVMAAEMVELSRRA